MLRSMSQTLLLDRLLFLRFFCQLVTFLDRSDQVQIEPSFGASELLVLVAVSSPQTGASLY